MTKPKPDIAEISASIINAMPQKPPFLFLDRIIEISEERIAGMVTFDPASWFYRGHFPSHPVTPGVILIETMAQTGVVALGIYLDWAQRGFAGPPGSDDTLTLFTDVTAEFSKMILPGEPVTIKAEKKAFRRHKIIADVRLYNARDELAATATLAGIGVRQDG